MSSLDNGTTAPGANPPPYAVQHYAKNGWKYDNRLTAMMVEDMIFNPILAAKVLLGIRVPPHMELRILKMWTTQFTNDDSGFSTGKSFTLAVVSALRSILFPGRISGILSGTFRQGQLIFQNYDRWYESSKIFKSCIKFAQGKPKLVHGSDAWRAYFRGGAEIRVLPPNFMGDSTRLRSERWHDGYLDEWTIFGNFEALTKTIIGRITATNHYPDCPVRQNHIHMASTPGYTHQPAYSIVRKIQANINGGNKDYGRFSSNYRAVPKHPDWEWLVNRKIVFNMQTMNPPGVVKAEVDGLWQADSLSIYSAKAVTECRRYYEALLHRRKQGEVFVGGGDIGRGQSRGNHKGDDFAFTIWRIPAKGEHAHPVHLTRKTGVTAEQMSGIVHDLHRKFNLSLIMYDPGGGGIFLRDELRKIQQTIKGEPVECTPIVEFDDITGTIGDTVLVPFSRSAMHIQQMWGKMTSPSVLVNRMHRSLKMSIDAQTILLPPVWNGWASAGIDPNDPDMMRRRLNKSTGFSATDRVKAELDLAVSQLIRVDVKRDAEGNPVTDQGGQYKFLSKFKKDSAYSLAYGFIAVQVYNYFMSRGLHFFSSGNDGESDTGFSFNQVETP